MKKKNEIKPLQLSRETVRQLDKDKLTGIAGGELPYTHLISYCVWC